MMSVYVQLHIYIYMYMSGTYLCTSTHMCVLDTNIYVHICAYEKGRRDTCVCIFKYPKAWSLRPTGTCSSQFQLFMRVVLVRWVVAELEKS